MERLKERLKKIIKLWPDIWAIPLTLVGLWASYYVLFLVDPSFGSFDIGYLQALLLAAVGIVVINALVFLGIEHNWKSLWKYYKDDEFNRDFKTLLPWQRIKTLLYLFSFLFGSLLLIFASLI